MILDEIELNFVLYLALSLLVIGFLLSLIAKASKESDSNNIENRLEKALPGVQCAQCGYPGCKAYAKALANGEVACTKCTPGGPDTAKELASILGLDEIPSFDNDDMIFSPRTVAFVHESICTGCTKCKRVCPVDAITGSPRTAHVIDKELCIGCDECVKICPVKCIELIKLDPTINNFNWEIHSIRITGGSNK